MAVPTLTPEIAIKDTMQVLPDAKTGAAGSLTLFGQTQRGPLLPAWGTRDRERALRWIYRHDYNWMVQGAFSGIMNTIASTPWEIKGPDDVSAGATKHYRTMLKAMGKEPTTNRPDVEYWQALLRGADFGRGWTSFVRKGIDFLRQDSGWFIELIAPGDPSKPPTGAVTGLAHLDALHCIPTGDPTYPVIYWDRQGGYHLLHHTRVMQMIDMPDGDETRPGYGLCALSRAVAIASQGILMGRYIETKLDDKPPPGMVIASGMLENARNVALNAYKDEQSRDEQPPWGKQLWFYGADPAIPVKIDTLSFTQSPENWSYKEYVELDIDALALAIGVDKTDLWQMTTGSMGSSGQAQLMAQKSRGKTIGVFRTEMERLFNDILPDDYEFKFTARDPQHEAEMATNAQVWAGVATSLKGVLGAEEIRQLLASQSEPIKDAITDENGNIRTVDDADIRPPQALVIAPPPANTEQVPGTAPKPESGIPAQQSTPQQSRPDKPVRKGSGMDAELGGLGDVDSRQKAIQATILNFESDFADLVKGRIDGDITANRFNTIAMAQLRKYGLAAFRDGLNEGGVNTTDSTGAPIALEPDEQAAYEGWLLEQSAYVSAFNKTLSKGATPDAIAKASLWANKSIMPIYTEGVISADKNGMYQWVVGNTEHCEDCLRLNGQVHRLRNYVSRGWVPQASKLQCGGWRCQCKFVKTNLPVSGGY